MSTNHTTNYNLNQWEATDKVLRTEFNEDNAKIDAALKSHDVELAGLEAQNTAIEAALAAKGNSLVYTTTYVGTGGSGQSNPVTISLPAKPDMLIVTAGEHVMFYAGGSSTGRVWYSGGGGGYVNVSWNGSQISWYGTGGDQQMNSNGKTFTVVAFCRQQAG